MKIKYKDDETQYDINLIPKDGKYYQSWKNEVGHRFNEEFVPFYFLKELKKGFAKIISCGDETRELIKLVFLRFV